MSSALQHAMHDARFDPVAAEVVRELVQARSAYKLEKYFHDCQPGCKPSMRVDRHIPLPNAPAPTCRMLYGPHLRFFAAGARYTERVFLAANRIGKTEAAAFEMRCHLTGLYPKWWVGRRFNGPIEAWAAGDTRQTTRDIIQQSLMGPHTGVGSADWRGMIDRHLVANVVRASGGVANCLDTVYVEHVEKVHGAPAISELGFKSYDQGRRVFQGTAKHLIWLDEEPPDGAEAQEAQAQGSSEIWTECLLRLMTTGPGAMMATFTPLRGMTPFLKAYLETASMPDTDGGDDVDAVSHFYPGLLGEVDTPEAEAPPVAAAAPPKTEVPSTRFLIGATWDDAPHLTPLAKATLWNSILPYQRDARTKGIPQLGAGAIYPIAESDIRIKDFPIPDHWRRGYGMDVGGGAKPTAAVFSAMDMDAGILYITSVYRRAASEPSLHAVTIKERMGDWNWPGVGDAAALILTEHDAQQLVNVYRGLGLDLNLPDKSVETGIQEVWDLLISGRLKVFASCVAWFEEFRLYQRDKHGRIRKVNDHVMDATRYLVRSGRQRMKTKPVKVERQTVLHMDQASQGLGWLGG